MSTVRIAGGHVLLPNHRVERADVLLDQDRGTIEAVGDPAALPSGDSRLDAQDGLVMPGLVNGHTHTAMTLLRGYADDKPLDRWLRDDIWPVEAALEPADVHVGTELAVVEMIRSGTTAFADMYFEMDAVADVVETTGVRARIGHGIVTVDKDDASAQADLEESVDIAETYAGAADGRIQTAVMPHSLTTVDESFLREVVDHAHSLDVPVHLHVNETRDEVDPIQDAHGQPPLVYADRLGVLEDAWVAHAVHLTDREIELLADRDTAVVHCPASNMKLASGIAPVQRLREAGVTVGIGTDGAASNNDLDMFDELRDAALLGKLGADDAAAVPAEAAVEMATIGGATALGFDTGRIEAGAPADVIVLDLAAAHLTPAHDLVSHIAYAARGSDVRHTICDGQILMRDRDLQTIDPDAVRDRASTQATALLDRVER